MGDQDVLPSVIPDIEKDVVGFDTPTRVRTHKIELEVEFHPCCGLEFFDAA
jgi:hypothetical protein